MGKRIFAYCTAVIVCFGMLAGCGSEEDSGKSSKVSSTASAATDAKTSETDEGIEGSVAETETETEQETVTTEPETAAETTETVTEAPATEPATETISVSGSFIPGMIGMPASELIQMFGGEFEAEIVFGGVYGLKFSELEDTWFYIEDHGFDELCSDYSYGVTDELKEAIASSDAPVERINMRSGKLDDFSIGMSYNECADFIGDFPVMGSDNGEYINGDLSSFCYAYFHTGGYVIELHFDCDNQLGYDANTGAFLRDDTPDIAADVIKKYDPLLQTICIKPFRQIDSSKIKAIKASSYLDPIEDGSYTHTYGPSHLIDYSLASCWCENAPGSGEGEYVDFTLDEGTEVHYAVIYNGLLENERSFNNNGRVSKLKIYSDGDYPYDMSFLLPTGYNKNYPRAIPMYQHDTKSVRFEVVDAVKGDKYEDTCISEIVLGITENISFE